MISYKFNGPLYKIAGIGLVAGGTLLGLSLTNIEKNRDKSTVGCVAGILIGTGSLNYRAACKRKHLESLEE